MTLKPLKSFEELAAVVQAIAEIIGPMPCDQRKIVLDQVALKFNFEASLIDVERWEQEEKYWGSVRRGLDHLKEVADAPLLARQQLDKAEGGGQ
jgi:hypothetical protein